jgi:hypothetical protein
VTNLGNPPRFWDNPDRRAAVVPERRGSMKLIPAILRVPVHAKSKADNDPNYLSRGGRGSKKARRRARTIDALQRAVKMHRDGLVGAEEYKREVLG